MDNNFMKIVSSDELNKIFENAGDKLIVLLFFTKNNNDCKRALSAFEKSALNHITSIFCVIDTDKFHGESRYVSNISNMPKIECYYCGNSLGSYPISNEREVEQIIRSGEQYVITQNNMRNNGSNQNNMMNPMGMVNQMTPQLNQMPQANLMQIQQQILNNAQMQNPMQYQYLMQNPAVLSQLANKQMQMLQQQQMMQTQMMPQMGQLNQMPQQNFFNQMNPLMPSMPTVNPTPIVTPTTPINPNLPLGTTNNAIPTLQQMQQMFQIFQMMQQMGVLNTQAAAPEPIKETTTDNTLVLPTGEKLIPLGNGKFGLIKKSS